MARFPERPQHARRTRDFTPLLIWTGGVLVAVLALVYAFAYFGSRTTVENCTVTSKDRGVSITSDGDGNTTSSTNYRVYSSCGTFEVQDNLFFGKFNSADTYGALVEGETYDFDVVGWRNGFLSLFPNVLEATAS